MRLFFVRPIGSILIPKIVISGNGDLMFDSFAMVAMRYETASVISSVCSVMCQDVPTTGSSAQADVAARADVAKNAILKSAFVIPRVV